MMLNKILLIFQIVIFFYSMSNNAYAYLDPGTGGIIIQALLGFIAAVITSLSFYWEKVKIFIKKIKKKITNNKNLDSKKNNNSKY